MVKGFNIKSNNNNHRNGLANLAHRAKQLNGAFLVESMPGEGTEVKLIYIYRYSLNSHRI
jgi:signal transduction histidine kinase